MHARVRDPPLLSADLNGQEPPADQLTPDDISGTSRPRATRTGQPPAPSNVAFTDPALEAYRQQRWAEALGLFEDALARWRGDGPSRIMAGRCQVYQKTPPPEEWDGVFEALTK